MNSQNFKSKKVMEKLFNESSEEKWAIYFFRSYLKYCFSDEEEIKVEKIEDKNIILEARSGAKLNIYILNNIHSKNILYSYKLSFARGGDILYGIIIKNDVENELIDLYCNPHNCLEENKAEFELTVYNIELIKNFVLETQKEIRNKINNNLNEDQFKFFINEMLRKEKLLVKNSIMRIF